MSYFFYHVIDNSAHIRVGYLEAVDQNSVSQLFKQAHVRSIEHISEVEKPSFFGNRSLFYIEVEQYGMHIYGTIESDSAEHALQSIVELQQSYVLKGISTENIELITDKTAIYAETQRLYNTTTTTSEPVNTEDREVSIIIDQTETAAEEEAISTVLDFKYRELLLRIGSKLGEVGRDPAYTAIVAELASIIFMQREKANTPLKEKYDTLHALMREIALIEDELDPTPLKSDLRDAVETIVPFLQQIEKLQNQTASEEEKNAMNEAKKGDNPFEKQRKEVIALHKSLEELQDTTHDPKETVDISMKSILTSELPRLLKWICISGITIKVLSDLVFFSIFNGSLHSTTTWHDMVLSLSTHTLYTKFLLAITGLYLFFAIYERFGKKYYMVLLSLLGFLCLIFFLSITP